MDSYGVTSRSRRIWPWPRPWALALAVAPAVVARQAKHQGNPSGLALTAAIATSSPMADAVTTTADALQTRRSCLGSDKGGQCWRKPDCLKATETNKDKATSALARLSARESSMALLMGVGGGPRLALAGRRLANALRPSGRARWPGGAAFSVADAGPVR
jgi:hypothetical protein